MSGPARGRGRHPDGKFAYVTNVGSKTISVVDLATNAVLADIPIDAGPPVYVAFTSDGSRAYISVHDEVRRAPNSVVVLDTQTRAVIATIPAEAFPMPWRSARTGGRCTSPTTTPT